MESLRLVPETRPMMMALEIQWNDLFPLPGVVNRAWTLKSMLSATSTMGSPKARDGRTAVCQRVATSLRVLRMLRWLAVIPILFRRPSVYGGTKRLQQRRGGMWKRGESAYVFVTATGAGGDSEKFLERGGLLTPDVEENGSGHRLRQGILLSSDGVHHIFHHTSTCLKEVGEAANGEVLGWFFGQVRERITPGELLGLEGHVFEEGLPPDVVVERG